MHSGKAESRQDASESAAEYVVVLAVEVVTRAAESAGENLFLVPHTACDGQELRGARVAVGSSNRITASYGIFSVSIDLHSPFETTCRQALKCRRHFGGVDGGAESGVKLHDHSRMTRLT